jgi:TolA-binding protein
MKSIPLFFLLILIFTLSLSAQRKSAKTRTSNQAANQVSINKEKEFDLSAERLPAGYRGNNFMQLISDISELKKLQEQKKDEYETLAQYQARMQKLENWRFSSGLTRDSLFGFVLHKDNFEPSYNADSQQLSATLSPQNFPDCTPSEEVWWRCKYFSLVSKGEDLGTYSASNVYGATRTVRVYHSLIVRLELFEEQPLS